MSYDDRRTAESIASKVVEVLGKKSKGQNARAALAAAVANNDQPMLPEVIIEQAEVFLGFLERNNT